jgi:hypothetical protein
VCLFSLVVFTVCMETFYIFHGILFLSRCFYLTSVVSSFPGCLLTRVDGVTAPTAWKRYIASAPMPFLVMYCILCVFPFCSGILEFRKPYMKMFHMHWRY